MTVSGIEVTISAYVMMSYLNSTYFKLFVESRILESKFQVFFFEILLQICLSRDKIRPRTFGQQLSIKLNS